MRKKVLYLCSKKRMAQTILVEAKEKELKNFQDYGAYKEVLDEGYQDNYGQNFQDYGDYKKVLDDSGLKWYKKIENKLSSYGCMKLHIDLDVFYYFEDQKLKMDTEISDKIIKPLMDSVTFGSSSEGTYKCLGWNIRHIDGSIRVSQSDYIEAKVDYLRIDTENRKKDDLLNKEEAAEVRAHIGRLRWLADQTRPDIAYDVLELSIVAHKPTVETIAKIRLLQKSTVEALKSIITS